MKKMDKAKVDTGDLRVWCEYCSIRIAPSEERISSDGKLYHQRCYKTSRSKKQSPREK